MLSKEQQQIVVDNMWVVNTILKNLELSHNEDLRQEGAILLIKALENYDASKGAKFSTYAMNYVYYRLIRIIKKEQAVNKPLVNIDDFYSLQDAVDFETQVCNKTILNAIKPLLTKNELIFFNGMLEGKKGNDFEFSRAYRTRLMKSIREKARQIITL